jgi:hypothetical protein
VVTIVGRRRLAQVQDVAADCRVGGRGGKAKMMRVLALEPMRNRRGFGGLAAAVAIGCNSNCRQRVMTFPPVLLLEQSAVIHCWRCSQENM